MKNMPLKPVCIALCLFTAQCVATAQDGFTDADSIEAFIHDNFDQNNACIVIGLVDEHENRVFSGGKLDNGTSQEVNGDSVFFIGSVTKTFTALLLLDMVERGELKLDQPVAKYLPSSVKMPNYRGREITLVDLATHTAGLPFNPDNMIGADVREQYESYTVERMYAFLSSYQVSRAPGTEYAYSNVGTALLGHVLARRANLTYESLLVERICKPLGMNSTRITLSPELQARLAMGHDEKGRSSSPFKLDAYAPAGNIHSTANDLLKYASAQVGLMPSRLTSAMEKSHMFRFEDAHGIPGLGDYSRMGRTAMGWVDRNSFQPPGMELLGHAGGAGSYHAWVGFDKQQRRGVVVLSTDNDLSVEAVGWTILQRLPLTEERKKLFVREMFGIGIQMDLSEQTGALEITKVLPESPAAKAGLSTGLVIQKIDGVQASGKSMEEYLTLLRGPAGTKVRLELVSPGRNETNTVELTRQKYVPRSG
jgi:D-alanyl-D-alanine-carboxypeptidase/D-alanyl-D-alanine-endopeptidase